MITIYHNPRCSKSRETLALVQDIATREQVQLHVVDYLKNAPNIQQLQILQKQLALPLRDMVRDNEEEYAALGLEDADEAGLLAALSAHPKLLQRPIVVYGERARIGRPPQNVLDLF